MRWPRVSAKCVTPLLLLRRRSPSSAFAGAAGATPGSPPPPAVASKDAEIARLTQRVSELNAGSTSSRTS